MGAEGEGKHGTELTLIKYGFSTILIRLPPVQEKKPKGERKSIYVEAYKQKLS